MPVATALFGLFLFIALAWVLSEQRRLFPWRTVIAGILLQFLLGWVILGTKGGAWFFSQLDGAFKKLLGFANEGVSLVFGPLADTGLLARSWGPENSFIFVVTVTGTIILVSALSSLLYHYGILQFLVRCMAWVMQRLMLTSGSESLATAANVFMGQTEAPLVVKPYLSGMTRSELMAMMTGGMATIAGGVMAAYVSFGISAGHLLTASFMSAPAALMMAKIILPETGTSETAHGADQSPPKESVNGIDAICIGASDGMKLAINVMAMLIAFVAIVALANYLLASLLALGGVENARPLQTVLGWANAPFAWLMGIPWKDCQQVGAILGERIVLNEFVSYLNLSQMMKTGGVLEARSATITTYALCGFANLASIAIQIGGIGALVPERRAELARLGGKAMLAGLLACYSTACIAGIILQPLSAP
ncbi:CNT family concentrative nucleoside transporter [Prosthecobacter fusiformis]|uniref:CNT family concentrative nucleoside transporter n=1 Tax=Prosthecobacter fusiformis TaxID=48464 RepID=A0A4R7RW95_9BACT|nr:nucleoside transporter C-terminal domain-containing protein [Prosthecobacter fusiformis]TDU69278.1 CNT family concentrative nucleoside transporter [Prosthecobacter fusiformis]